MRDIWVLLGADESHIILKWRLYKDSVLTHNIRQEKSFGLEMQISGGELSSLPQGPGFHWQVK